MQQINRRNLMGAAGGLAVLAAAGSVAAQTPGGAAPAAAKVKVPTPSKLPTKPLKDVVRASLITALADCMMKANACAAHCEQELAAGNKEMAACAKSVADMLALCHALASLAPRASQFDAKLAALCAEACAACAKACKAHEPHFAHGMHLTCKACMDACVTCEAACRKFAAA